jgi:hypothetical protein
VVIEIQRYQRLYRSVINKLGFQKPDGLPRPFAHRAGIRVIHLLPEL